MKTALKGLMLAIAISAFSNSACNHREKLFAQEYACVFIGGCAIAAYHRIK